MVLLKLQRISIGFVLLFATVFAAHALPGVQSPVSDQSGEYVYWRDTSFQRESIVGAIYYDDSTYALRYFAPADAKKKLAQKDIAVYLTVDPDSSVLKLTGENIVGITEAQDTDIVNYLHDLFYELTARRQKTPIAPTGTTSSVQDFVQFGGNVTLVFDARIPIFNLVSITGADGMPILDVQVTGRLVSSEDTSFSAYKGIQSLPKDKKRTLKKSKAQPLSVDFEGHRLELDTRWARSAENLFLLGDSALLTVNTIPAQSSESSVPFETSMLRLLCQSTEGSYIPLKFVQIGRTPSGDLARVTAYSVQPAEGNLARIFHVLTPRSSGDFAYLMLSVFDGAYQRNRAYFDAILGSYRAE